MSDAHDLLDRAKHHLRRVLEAWPDPTDWEDLTIYGFYCVEAAVMAAATHSGLTVPPSHPAKADAASRLAARHGLPDVSRLLAVLNTARKAAAYGDRSLPSLNAEKLAREIEAYARAVEHWMHS